jgi:hypothetical protein
MRTFYCSLSFRTKKFIPTNVFDQNLLTMFRILPLLCVFLSYLTRVYAIIEATASIGNQGAGEAQTFVSQTANATFFGVRWDGDKVRGLALNLSDGTSRGKMVLRRCLPSLVREPNTLAFFRGWGLH